MTNEKTLTQTELLEKLNIMKDEFSEYGSEENLYISLRYVLKHGLEEHILDKDVSTAFASIFAGHKTDRSMSSLHALLSAIRDIDSSITKRQIRKKIVLAVISYPTCRKDHHLRTLVKRMEVIKGSIDDVIKNPQLISV